MRHALSIAFAVIVLQVPNIIHASEEEFAIWNEVDIQTFPIEEAGVARFKASFNSARLSEASVSAFGKKFELSPDQLRDLKEFPLSSLSITYEAGYRSLGGFTVHFKFHRAAYDPSKHLIQERLTISIPKDAEMKFSRRAEQGAAANP